jgi:hypothetical protein
VSLVVEVTRVEGTLAINIPPPPSDRVWYVKGDWVILFISLFFSTLASPGMIELM